MRGLVTALGCAGLWAAVLATAATGQAGELVLVRDGRPQCTLVVGSGSAVAERNVAKVLAARIRKRTGCDVPIVGEKDAERSVAKDHVAVLVGTPSGNALVRRLCAQAGKLVPTPEAVGPAGFVVHTVESGGRTWIVLSGSDTRGTNCAVGKFLRKLDFAGRSVTVRPLSVVDKIDPAKVMDSQQYKPAQWGNSFKDAPIGQIREYIEDMALWGSCSMWNVCCYKINNPFAKDADERSRTKWERVRDLFAYAHSLGLGIGYVDCPNSVYDDQLGLRKLGGKFRYREDVCPSIPDVRKVLLENREALCRAAKEAGIDFKYFLYFAHDNGGCDCPKCAPWITTFIGLSHDMHRIAARYHPNVKIYLTTWMCNAAEKKLMLDYVRNEKPDWVAGVMDRPGVKLPEPYVSVGWQTIFGCASREVYGKMGGDPLPHFIPGKIQEYYTRGIRAVYTYTEGPYDDINSAIVAQVCRHPFSTDVRDLLTEYCHWHFGTAARDSAAFADLILTKFRHTRHGPFNAALRVEDPDGVLVAMEALEKRMPQWGRDDWRYGILKVRVQLEALDTKARTQGAWIRRLVATLAAGKKGDAALARALGQARGQLAELEASFDTMQTQCAALTKRLYVDLYGSPNRSPAHGRFRLELPWRGLAAALGKRCGELAVEKDAAKRRDGVALLLTALTTEGAHAPGARGARPVLRQEGTITIPGAAFRGGAGLRLRPGELLAHGANVVDAASSGHSKMTAIFLHEPGEEPLKEPVKLTLRGTDCCLPHAVIEVSVNRHKVFVGECQFPAKGYGDQKLAIRPEYIVAGQNRLRIANLEPGRGGRHVLIASATLQVARAGEVPMPELVTQAKLPSRMVAVPRNLATGKRATASSVYDERFPPSKAVDGQPIMVRGPSENAWACEKGKERGALWQVDLGKPVPIREVRVWFRNLWPMGNAFVPVSITFQVSDDGTTWRTVLSKSRDVPKEGSPYAKTPSVFRLNAKGRHLRLLFEDGTQNTRIPAIEITEVEVQ